MKYDYRNTARDCLRRATILLETNEDEKLSYACLELRKCVEALSYDLFTSYLQEVPLKAFEAWQPDKIIKELLRIDPGADKGSHMRFKREGQEGELDGPWVYMGEERRLKAKR